MMLDGVDKMQYIVLVQRKTLKPGKPVAGPFWDKLEAERVAEERNSKPETRWFFYVKSNQLELAL
jgi:hypothetical protein